MDVILADYFGGIILVADILVVDQVSEAVPEERGNLVGLQEGTMLETAFQSHKPVGVPHCSGAVS